MGSDEGREALRAEIERLRALVGDTEDDWWDGYSSALDDVAAGVLPSADPAVVTRGDIHALRREAAAHGDPEQVAECDRALDGDAAAWEACVEVIEAARDRRANG